MLKRLSFKDDFEMLILRHDYLRKVKNPDPSWVYEFEGIVRTTASIMFSKYQYNFQKIGYDLEDIVTVANCYMVSYMSLYSIRRNKDVASRIEKSYLKRFNRKPTKYEISRKERINMISFLRQKLTYASVLCSRKAKNIVVGSDESVVYAFTKNSRYVSKEIIFDKPDEAGFRKLTNHEFKEIKKKAKENNTHNLKDAQGYSVFKVNRYSSGLSEKDYRDLFLENKDNIYINSPEQSMQKLDEEINMTLIIEKFFKMTNKEKEDCLVKFINLFKNNNKYSDEITEARKMLKSL